MASVVGLKMHEHIQYQRKVSYYSKLSENVRLKAPERYKNEDFYLPNWTDDKFWTNWHIIKSKAQDEGKSGELFKSKYPTPKEFKDYCFKEAEKDEKFEQCETGWGGGWCEECLWNPTWQN